MYYYLLSYLPVDHCLVTSLTEYSYFQHQGVKEYPLPSQKMQVLLGVHQHPSKDTTYSLPMAMLAIVICI